MHSVLTAVASPHQRLALADVLEKFRKIADT